jgi:acetyltransferase-like isoleucine patch superfamily enzyme
MSDTMQTEATPARVSAAAKAGQILREDTAGLHLRLQLANMAARLLPTDMASRLRAALLSRAGFSIGEGTVIRGRPHINGRRELYGNLVVGRGCLIDVGCTLDLEEQISLGDRVTIGHEAMLLTSSHEIGPKEHRAGAIVRGPISVGAGAWIGPRAVILPGITVGAGAVVTAGSLVNKDVPPNTRVAGIPAKQVEELPEER